MPRPCLLATWLLCAGAAVCSESTEAQVAQEFPKCPEHTYPKYKNDKHAVEDRPNHCICPSSYFCEGCEEGCQAQGAWMKFRCVKGFKPECGHKCRCSPLESQSKTKTADDGLSLGRMHDRRSQPFCDYNATTLSWIKQHKYTGDYNFVFIISNGHTGTTYLGQQSNWVKMFGTKSDFLNQLYITHEQEASKDAVKDIGWHHDFCDRALDYVAQQKIPKMTSVLGVLGKTIYFASGHQIILGMIPALIKLLGDKAKFVRLRRNKYDVAYSYAAKTSGPCTGRCIYCTCPLDAAARLSMPGTLWQTLSTYQRYLWFVDEVEAQWGSILNTYPDINHIEVDWDKKLTPDMFTQIARYTGVDVTPLPEHAEVTASNQHLSSSDRSHKNYTWMEEEDAGYQAKLGLKECGIYHCMGGPTPKKNPK